MPDNTSSEPSVSAARRDGIVVKHGHDDLGEDDFHEWVTLGERLLLDTLGRPNPRLWGNPNWSVWICNNTDCGGRVLVHDCAVQGLVREAVDA